MKKILSVTNRAEAYLLAEALRQEGIHTSVQEEWGSLDGTSTTFIWIENDGDAERATALLAEMTGKRQPAPVVVRSSSEQSSFVRGLLLGLLLAALAGGALAVWRLNGQDSPSSDNWDLNGDGSGPPTIRRDNLSNRWRIAILMARQIPGCFTSRQACST